MVPTCPSRNAFPSAGLDAPKLLATSPEIEPKPENKTGEFMKYARSLQRKPHLMSDL
jgi:hypothetical protein